MANLTITVDDELLKRARIKALEEGTSVNAILAKRLEEYASSAPRIYERQAEAIRQLVAIGEYEWRNGGEERAHLREAEEGPFRWSREDLYQRGPGRYDTQTRKGKK